MPITDYCTLDDVKSWMPGENAIDEQGPAPNATVVKGWITKFSGEIDNELSRGGATVPATNDRLLAKINVHLAQKIVCEVMAKRQSMIDKDIQAKYDKWCAEYDAMLEEFAAGQSASTGAASTVSPSLSATQDPVFTRDMIF